VVQASNKGSKMKVFPGITVKYKRFQFSEGKRFFGMRSRELPYDETHQFLLWGERDTIFRRWLDHLNSKGVPFDLVEDSNGQVAIFKHHMVYTLLQNKNYGAKRCCL